MEKQKLYKLLVKPQRSKKKIRKGKKHGVRNKKGEY
jgi:hypothetical protein